MCRKFSFLVSFVLVLCLVGNTWGIIANQDIGSPGIPGSASEAAGVWTVEGSGADIWGGNDAFHYVYRPMEGNGIMKVNLTSMTITDPWAKVGVMIRETLAANSKHAMIATTGSKGCQFVWRENTGGDSYDETTGGQIVPKEMWIERDGDTLRGTFWYWAIQNVYGNWMFVERTIPMNTDVYIGLVVCSHNDGALCTAEFEGPGTPSGPGLEDPPIPNPGSPVSWPAAPYNNAWLLMPEDGATSLPVTQTLTWMPGDDATSHDVYLGTSPTPTDEASVATKALGDESYTPDTPLAEGTMYYWQIIEQPGDYAGPIYSFKTERTGTGMIDYQIWFDIEGGTVPDLTSNPRYPDDPTVTGQITVLDSGEGLGDNYGARAIGYLAPETSGDYTFWIASDDDSELWLSTSGKGCEAVMISSVAGWTGYHAYDWQDSQKSAPIYLEGGQKYPIWALWKEGGGGDHCSVAWEGPDAPSRTEIDGYFLMPGYVNLEASKPIPADGAILTVQEVATVSFTPASGATEHQVLFGEAGSMAPYATLSADETSVAVSVEVGKSYEWQVNELFGTEVAEGCPWSFSVEEWASIDIGNAWGGSATQSGDCWIIVADGGDIWGNGDHFHFVYQTPTFTRDEGTIIANVKSLVNTNTWAKAGVMIRETTASGSKNSCMLTTCPDGQNLASFQWRSETGGGSDSVYEGGLGGIPEWVKLVRKGNLFKGYYSEDGINWTQRGEQTVEMNSFVRVGLAVTSHNSGALTTAEICDLSITTPDPRQAWNLMPQCGATGQSIHATVSWNAGDGVASQRVYFSSDEAAVMARTTLTAELPADVTECDPNPAKRQSLMLTETYYWVVDSVMPDGTVIPGEICSFTVADHRLVDDFESYPVDPEALPEQEMVPGDILVEAVPPPDNTWVEPKTIVLVAAVAPGEDCLVSRWDFEGDFTDSGGGGNDGTPVGDATIVADPDKGNVLSLGGAQDYVDCGNPDELNFSTGDWSLSAWVKNTMTGTGDDNKGSIIANGGDGGGGHRYCMVQSEQDEGEVTLVTDDNSSKKQARGDATKVNDGTWHHVLGIREGDSIRIYIDGKLEGSSGTNANYDLSGASQANVLIGAITKASDSSIYKTYEGLIDDARIYNCALSAGNARYMAGLGDLTVEKDGYFGPTIVHWAMDEGSGDTAFDSTDNHLDGAISGALWDATTADGSASCLDFNGFGDNVLNLAAGPYLNGLDAMTISLWVQSDLTDTDKGFFMGSDSGSDRHGMRYDRRGGSADPDGIDVIKYGVRTNEGNEEDESSENLQTTDWQHILMTWESGVGLTLYINGYKDSPTFDAGAKGGITDGYNRILAGKGSKDGADDAGWDGRIDDLRILDYVVSEGERRWLAGIGNKTLPDWYHPLIARYDFDAGEYTDSTRNHFDGIPLDGVSIADDPTQGMAATFDGDGDCVDIGNSELFNPGAGDFSVSVWINMSSYDGNWSNAIVGKRGEGGQGWQLRRLSDTHRISFTTRGGGDEDGWGPGGTDIPLNEWVHVAAVRKGTQKCLYVNGKPEAVSDIGDYIEDCTQNVYIGARAAGDNNPEAFFNGMIDELHIYDIALTWGQVITLYDPQNLITTKWSGRAAASPKLDHEIAHWGSQSMRVEYTGDGAVNRIDPFGDGADPHEWSGDWTLGGTEALSIYFRGDPDNAPGMMFAQLTTTVESAHTQRVVYDGDPENLTIPEWQEWNIKLHDLYTGKPFVPPLPDEGLPATKIKSVGVGIIGAGSGVLHFDDLRIYPTRCVAQYAPSADITGDCIVNMDDLKLLAGDWLDGDKTELGLVARYEFEGDLTDSSGNGHDGTANGDISFADDRGGQVLSLPGGDDQYVSIPPVGISGNDPTTIACWAKSDTTDIPDWTLVFGFSTEGGGCGSHFNIGNIGGPGGIGAHAWCFEDTIFTDDEALEWRHYAMTFDGTTITYYGDGDYIGQVDMDLSIRGDRVNIGKRNTQASSFPGKVDDARIYNRELSTAEINTVMSGAEIVPVYTPLESAANLYDEEPVNSKKINFKDYALLMQEWLLEIYWP